MMNYWTIQSTAIALLKARADFAAIAATGILPDDGSYPKTPGVESVLATLGLCLVVTEPFASDPGDAALSGTTHELIQFSVLIRYRSKAAIDAGILLTHWHTLDIIRKTLQGQPSSEPNPHLRFQSDSPPWDYDGNVGGDNRVNVHFSVGHILTP